MPPTPTVRQNGHALRSFREIRGLSVADLAERADVSPSALRNWELENKALPTVKAERLCVALSIRIAAIVREPLATAQPDQDALQERTAS
ncbi:helix-turn-helix transcriptional regulator [Nonomuraea sp. NPDC048901]|uniref:helix-turn-helix transcriptional regulator n=1 Tax=Nonomuraea sp. NPDC048901 TaxID=3155627 RepID=UPI0033CA99E3